tara:strand:- start:1428 stop:1610 length:183 start_codon:yes stop_codon:yes gene_type:complete
MGAMKSYLLWLEEKGYVEWVDNFGWDYLVDKDKALKEYLGTLKPSVSDVTTVAEDPDIDT